VPPRADLNGHNLHCTTVAPFVGYVGEITQPQLKARKSQGYKLGDVIGQAGIEASYDSYLRGTSGSAQLTVDSRGRPKRVRWWLMRPDGGEFAPNDEVDAVRWAAPGDATTLLSYDRDLALLEQVR